MTDFSPLPPPPHSPVLHPSIRPHHSSLTRSHSRTANDQWRTFPPTLSLSRTLNTDLCEDGVISVHACLQKHPDYFSYIHINISWITLIKAGHTLSDTHHHLSLNTNFIFLKCCCETTSEIHRNLV